MELLQTLVELLSNKAEKTLLGHHWVDHADHQCHHLHVRQHSGLLSSKAPESLTKIGADNQELTTIKITFTFKDFLHLELLLILANIIQTKHY